MTIFECEDTVDGIFTAVYDAWDSRLGHANVRLQLQGVHTLQLFADYREVVTDGGKAEKVARTIRRRMGTESYEMIYRAASAQDAEKADAVYRVIVLGLSERSGVRSAEAIRKLQDPSVCHVFELARKVWHETHRYLGFVRFRELESGVLFSEIEAEAQVLPMLAIHFADRFPNENFMIYDHGHRDCLVHRAGGPWVILKDTEPDTDQRQRLSEDEAGMQRLWRGFCRSISIKERENPALQRQVWPLKFRKWMTEAEDENLPCKEEDATVY